MKDFDTKLKEVLVQAFDKEWLELEEETALYGSIAAPEGFDSRVIKKAYAVLYSGNVSCSKISMETMPHLRGRSHFRRALIVAALIATMIVGTITAYALTHPEIIYNIKKSVVEWTFHFRQNDPDNVVSKLIPVKPETPEGFEITSEEEYPGLYEIVYEKNEKMILFDQHIAKSLGLKISGEGDEYLDVTINGYRGVAYHDTNDWNIMWDNGYYVFDLTGNVEYEILLKMAESVE